VKKILAVINATYAVAKRKPEKIRLAGIRTLTSAIPVQRRFGHYCTGAFKNTYWE